ncbi:MAG: hypothetical protein A2W91_14190 [Bacteroidetes bacterium GWF2_38_335]|nr:MAG: hypothetical protein A2W91_14190 [Bacteroidetes bacterium GWF2_38_335]OFY79387.1 MAG: hypothetical protein A2281_16965 [Bacteroidetes bacterium RIFOXYA12_FULL_38_20]HBS85651.1 hypothetical protein [Bacteroidales bacterium]
MTEQPKRPDAFYGYLEGWISLVLNIALFALKYWAGIVSGSVSLLAGAWHTLSDSFTSIVVLIGFKVSSAPIDRKHPFGRGKAELVGNIIIGAILAVIGSHFLIESISKLRNHESASFGTLAIIVSIISLVIKEALARFAFILSKKINSRSLFSEGWHHRSETFASALILIGIVLNDQFWWIDAVLGLLITGLIFYTAFELLREKIRPLIGVKPDPELINKLQEMAQAVCKRDLHINHAYIHEYGNVSEIRFHVQIPGNTSLNDAHSVVIKLEKEIKERLKMEAIIHVEPMDIKTMDTKAVSFYKRENPGLYEECLKIRKEVFVDEQKVDISLEIDEHENECKFWLIQLDGESAATGRWRLTPDGYKLERFAVLNKYRATGLGRILLEHVLSDILPTDKPIYLYSQTSAVGFYEKYGFYKTGEPFIEANIEHYKMIFDM